MELTAVFVILIAFKIDFILSNCPDESWLRVTKVSSLAQDFPGPTVCIKGFRTPKSWQDASSTCRLFHGNLVRFDQDYRYGSRYNSFVIKEFWTGMYVTKDRFKVPLLDGVPPQRVNETYYNRNSKTWNWGNREPKMGAMCQLMTSGTGKHNASMASCDRLLPFYCAAPTIFPINTTLCPSGSLSAGLCYTAYNIPLSYDEAVIHCGQEGGSLAVYDGENILILAGAVPNNNVFPMSELRAYYINDTSVGGTDGSGGGGDIPINLCTIFNMGDVYLEKVPCDVKNGVICQHPLTIPPTQDDVIPVFQALKTSGESSRSGMYKMQCSLERNLMDFESMVTYFNGVPMDANPLLANRPITEITQFGDDYQAIGEYWCEIQNARTSNKVVSNKIIYEFPRSSSLTYRGYANFTARQQNLSISLYNLKFLQDARYYQSSLQFLLQTLTFSINSGVRDLSFYQEPPLFFNSDIASGYKDIGKMSEDGASINFAVYFNIHVRTFNDPQWFTAEKDQFALGILKERIERSLIFNEVPSRRKRRKRQSAPDFWPNIVLLSTGSCSAFSVYDLDLERMVSFGSVAAGDTAFSTEICITDKRPLANVTCIGSFYKGASYGDIRVNRKCVFNGTAISGSTTTLQRLAETEVNGSDTTDILEQTYNLTQVDDLTSLDVIYTASILTNVANSTDKFDQKIVEYSADIVNTMIGLNEDILNQAQDIGSGTSRLVEALETISNNIVLDAANSASIVRPFVASKIRQFSGDTNLVVGLQLKDSPSVTITNSSLTVLEDEMKLDISVTDAAIILPKTLLQGANTTRLLLQIYSSTKLFNSISSSRRFMAQGKIAAASLTQDQRQILSLGKQQVKTIFKPFKQTEGLVCGFWDYSKNDNSGGWSTEGCSLQSQDGDRAICVCDHLTNFAILIDFEAQGNYVKAHQLALSIITIIGLVLSIIGLSFTIICFLIFKALRKTRGQKVLFQLAVAMLCSWVVFLTGVEQTQDYNGCIAVAILLHYFILVTFMWLLIEGLLQYLRFVKVLGTYIPRFMLKASLFSWGLPLIPVIVVCAIDYRLYDGGIHYCWMSLTPFYYAFALPVGLVILTNIIVFILVIVNLVRRPAGLQSNQSERKRALMNFWAALSIFVLLGVTWIFGYLAIEDARIPFQYIFTICNAFQGFFIFLLFVTRDPQVRKEWTAMCCGDKKKKDHTGYDSSAGSKSKDSTAFTDLSSAKKPSLT